jgi:hypothetical protein
MSDQLPFDFLPKGVITGVTFNSVPYLDPPTAAVGPYLYPPTASSANQISIVASNPAMKLLSTWFPEEIKALAFKDSQAWNMLGNDMLGNDA